MLKKTNEAAMLKEIDWLQKLEEKQDEWFTERGEPILETNPDDHHRFESQKSYVWLGDRIKR